MVYLITNRFDGHCKIGCSKDPEKRLRALQTANANKLKLESVLPGMEYEERTLHDLFKKHHLNGEWFDLDEEIEDYFEEYGTPVIPDKVKKIAKTEDFTKKELLSYYFKQRCYFNFIRKPEVLKFTLSSNSNLDTMLLYTLYVLADSSSGEVRLDTEVQKIIDMIHRVSYDKIISSIDKLVDANMISLTPKGVLLDPGIYYTGFS